MIKINFLGDKVPKGNWHYACIAFITIDSVKRMKKNSYPQVYLEECKYKIKKIKVPQFNNAEEESDSSSDSE